MDRVQEIDILLTRAAVASAALSPGARRRVLQTVLSAALKNSTSEYKQQMLNHLLAKRVPSGQIPPIHGRPLSHATEKTQMEHAPPELEAVVKLFLKNYFGAKVPWEKVSLRDLAISAFKELDKTLRKNSGVGEEDRLPWRAMLMRVKSGVGQDEDAMKYAAHESFARLLNALNPEIIKQHTPKKAMQMSTAYKAVLFDVLQEKFTQLNAYHQKGRLLRDFRSLYRDYFKQKGEKLE